MTDPDDPAAAETAAALTTRWRRLLDACEELLRLGEPRTAAGLGRCLAGHGADADAVSAPLLLAQLRDAAVLAGAVLKGMAGLKGGRLVVDAPAVVGWARGLAPPYDPREPDDLAAWRAVGLGPLADPAAPDVVPAVRPPAGFSPRPLPDDPGPLPAGALLSALSGFCLKADPDSLVAGLVAGGVPAGRARRVVAGLAGTVCTAGSALAGRPPGDPGLDALLAGWPEWLETQGLT